MCLKANHGNALALDPGKPAALFLPRGAPAHFTGACGAHGLHPRADPATVEPDSDIRAVAIDRVVSLCPLSNDLTARTSMGELEAWGGVTEVLYP